MISSFRVVLSLEDKALPGAVTLTATLDVS